jgi:hypothetical protein
MILSRAAVRGNRQKGSDLSAAKREAQEGGDVHMDLYQIFLSLYIYIFLSVFSVFTALILLFLYTAQVGHNNIFFISFESWPGSVGIVIACGLDDQRTGVRFQRGGEYLLRVQTGSGSCPAFHPKSRQSGALSPGVGQ